MNAYLYSKTPAGLFLRDKIQITKAEPEISLDNWEITDAPRLKHSIFTLKGILPDGDAMYVFSREAKTNFIPVL